MLQQKVVYIKHSQLIPSESNRTVKRNAANTKARAATIKHLGAVIQNLVVSPVKGAKGKYSIHAGNGRYESVQLLISEGHATPDFEYPALIAEDNSAIASLIKLAENGNRDNLHPVDEFLTYQAAINDGNDIKAVANANGVSQKYVKQRLKLADLSPVLLDALRNDDIDLDAAAAYTLGKTHEAQEQAYVSLGQWDRNSEHSVKRFLTETKIPSNSPLARLVGKAAYRKAGGAITSNLFGDNEYFEDKDLLLELARGILDASAKKLTGWKWVDIDLDGSQAYIQDTSCLSPTGYDVPKAVLAEEAKLKAEIEALESKDDTGFTQSDQKRYDEAEDRLYEIRDKNDQFAVYDRDEMQFAGCIVGVDDEGNIEIVRGRVKPEDRKHLEARRLGKEIPEVDDVCDIPIESEAGSGGYTQALVGDLSSTRAALLQVAVSRDPAAAYDLGVFTLADSLLREGMVGWTSKATNISVSVDPLAGADDSALVAVDKAKQGLNLTWAKSGKPAKRFEAFCALTADEKAAIFAFCVARGIQPHLYDQKHNAAAMIATIERVKPNYREAWTPRKDTFFKRITQTQLVEIGTELLGGEWGAGNANSKKRDLVNELSSMFEGEKDLPDVERAKISQWVPRGF